jgi:large-conductance mechanosensitive channel
MPVGLTFEAFVAVVAFYLIACAIFLAVERWRASRGKRHA